MKKLLFLTILVIGAILLSPTPPVSAQTRNAGDLCDLDLPNGGCKGNTICQRATKDTPGFYKEGEYRCFSLPASPKPLDIFGKVVPPKSIIGLGFGAEGASKFLSNLVVLIYILAGIVLVFMILWGAFDWMTSGGDKEKLTQAKDKIMNALIGILLFAAAFAILQVLGAFTGFKFFNP